MFAPFAAPPPTYTFDYTTSPPMSPSQAYYSPRYSVHTATPSPCGSPKSAHGRRASYGPSAFGYTSPRMPSAWPPYQSTNYYSHGYAGASQRNADYVRDSTSRARSNSSRQYYYHVPPPEPAAASTSRYRARPRSNSQRIYVEVDADDDEDGGVEGDGDYYYYYAYPREYSSSGYDRRRRDADSSFYEQIPIYTEAAAAGAADSTPRRARASTHHRASHSTHHATPQKSAKHSTPKSSSKATDEDARRAGIPAGYSYKNWDPTEEPIMLLGSVFDANSLGKWIYDWTVFHHGPATPIAEIAGELWLLLIQLAGKMKRGEECLPRIRSTENRELVEDFLESGERLWARFRKLLKACEEYMWRAAKKEGGSGKEKKVSMGKDSGCEFVDAIFGRDRELDRTEKVMQGMRYWKVRFDANCEDILRHPSA